MGDVESRLQCVEQENSTLRVDFYSFMSKMENMPELIVLKMKEYFEEEYLKKSEFDDKWDKKFAENKDKELDRREKRSSVGVFFLTIISLVSSFVGVLIGVFIKTGSFVSGFIK